MLGKFREEREKRKMAPASSTAPSSGAAGGAGKTGGGDHRSSRDERERDRGYDRHASRYE
jgi:hypothetical protein